MADNFADRYWPVRFWSARYFQGGEQNPGAMQASLSGGGFVIASLTSGQRAEQAPRYGGGGAPIWPGALEVLLRKKRPKKKEIVREVAEIVEQAIPTVTRDESKIVAARIASQMTVRQLREVQTINALIARVEAELAEMDDEEVLLLAA